MRLRSTRLAERRAELGPSDRLLGEVGIEMNLILTADATARDAFDQRPEWPTISQSQVFEPNPRVAIRNRQAD
jgi:hypothetical protein